MIVANLISLGLLFAIQSSDQEATPTASETTPPSQPQAEPTEATESSDDVVCRKVHVTGWRVGKKKVCYTRWEWELIEAEAQDNLRRRTMMEGDARVSGRTKP